MTDINGLIEINNVYLSNDYDDVDYLTCQDELEEDSSNFESDIAFE